MLSLFSPSLIPDDRVQATVSKTRTFVLKHVITISCLTQKDAIYEGGDGS